MNLIITLATSNRILGKRFRKIFPEFSIFSENFSQVKLINPLYDTVFLILIDGNSELKILEVKDGDLTLTAGAECKDELELRETVWKYLRDTIHAIGFTKPDLIAMLKLVERK